MRMSTSNRWSHQYCTTTVLYYYGTDVILLLYGPYVYVMDYEMSGRNAVELASFADLVICHLCAFSSNLTHPFIVVGLSFLNKYRERKRQWCVPE